MTTPTFTREMSNRLDAYARANPNRVPLQPDPRLWELFEDDRAATRRRRQAHEQRNHPGTVNTCQDCGRLKRPKGTRLDQYPGTVCSGTRELCQWCHRAGKEQS